MDDTRRLMQGAAELLDEHFNPGLTGKQRTTGFIVIAFSFGDGDRQANYVSNGGSRAENVEVLEKLARRLKQ
jgi:hypothetical protein